MSQRNNCIRFNFGIQGNVNERCMRCREEGNQTALSVYHTQPFWHVMSWKMLIVQHPHYFWTKIGRMMFRLPVLVRRDDLTIRNIRSAECRGHVEQRHSCSTHLSCYSSVAYEVTTGQLRFDWLVKRKYLFCGDTVSLLRHASEGQLGLLTQVSAGGRVWSWCGFCTLREQELFIILQEPRAGQYWWRNCRTFGCWRRSEATPCSLVQMHHSNSRN